jgi:hypothetical protein
MSHGLDKFVFSVIVIVFASTIWIFSVSALPQQEQTSLGVKITKYIFLAIVGLILSERTFSETSKNGSSVYLGKKSFLPGTD